MAWKVLEPKRARGQEPAINISRNGKIMWSLPVHQAMGEPARIDVLHDSANQRLGIRPAAGESGLKTAKEGRTIFAKGTLMAAGVWSRLELPIAGRPALRDSDGVWAISIKPDLPIRRRRNEDQKDPMED